MIYDPSFALHAFELCIMLWGPVSDPNIMGVAEDNGKRSNRGFFI
jgi:hypothetical protein